MIRDSGSAASHVEWVQRKLHVGDVITLRVMEFVEGNKPIRLEQVDPKEDERQLRDYYETLKKRFEPTEKKA